jgi:hypothetical protein
MDDRRYMSARIMASVAATGLFGAPIHEYGRALNPKPVVVPSRTKRSKQKAARKQRLKTRK